MPPALAELRELLSDDERWEEDSRTSIEQLNVYADHAPQAGATPSKWPARKRVAGLVGAVVLGVIVGLKAAWELGLFDWAK